MSINTEVTTGIMDTIPFLLITPEFLGAETLSSIRNCLTNVTNYIGEQIVPYFGLVYLLNFGLVYLLTTLLYAPMILSDMTPISLLESHRVFENIIGIFYILVFFVGVTLGTVQLTLVIVKRLFIRQAMFVMGAILFFLARAISWPTHGVSPEGDFVRDVPKILIFASHPDVGLPPIVLKKSLKKIHE